MGEPSEPRESARVSGEAARGHVLARLASLAQIGELVRRLQPISKQVRAFRTSFTNLEFAGLESEGAVISGEEECRDAKLFNGFSPGGRAGR